ncbi:MAG TPA: LLM class flavin-dependent oxidoreductase [Acidimicrobiales bacterium]|nr:LLM class flavin-dependent oxidoreductase [Acidimicrobiales bacterium]
MRLGITLPQFSANALGMVEAAQRAEGEGLDAVFAYDHYPRPDRPEALHGHTMLGALAMATTSVTLGSLVTRIGVVPDGVVLAKTRTAARLAPGRFVCGLGVGDGQSDPEDAALGITRPSVEDRWARLEFVAAELRADGIEVWVGGRSRRAAVVSAALGVGRNLWEPTETQLYEALSEAEGRFVTWGATRDLTDVHALAAELARLAGLGVGMAIVAPYNAGAADAAARVMSAKAAAGLR